MRLPDELLLMIGEWLSVPSLNAFSRTAKYFHHLFHDELYSRALLHADQHGVSPLEWAAKGGRLSTLNNLLKHVPSQDLQTNPVLAALYAAVGAGRVQPVQLILTSGVAAHPPRTYRQAHASGWTPLHNASVRGYREIAGLLIKFGAKVNTVRPCPTQHQYAAIHLAAREGHPEIVKMLLEAGATHTQSHYRSPLHWSALRGHARCAALLIGHGADVNAATQRGTTPLHDAARCSRPSATETVELLLRSGAVTQATDVAGSTPLHNCAAIDVAQLLLDHAADVNAMDRHGNAPLHSMALYGRIDMMKFLSSHGANVDARNGNGATAWDILCSDPEYDSLREHLEPAECFRLGPKRSDSEGPP